MGRVAERAAITRLLDRAAAGRGGILVLIGRTGSGKSALLELTADLARDRGLDALGARVVRGQHPRLAWATLLRPAGAPDGVIERLLGQPSAADLDAAARQLLASRHGLVLIDDLDLAGPDGVEPLAILAAQVSDSSTAVVVASSRPLGVGTEVELATLTEAQVAELTGESRPDVVRAIWAAARGMPGVAGSLAARLTTLPPDADPVVALALRAEGGVEFLDVDAPVVRLIEIALERATRPADRAALSAQLARELMGDTSTVLRRRGLLDEAAALAEQVGDPRLQAQVIDARLHALWAPDVAEERLAAAARIVELAQAAGDVSLELRGMFWRFVGLVEAGRIGEAESALVAYERIAPTDAATRVLVLGRHGMLALLRGRYDDARHFAAEVAEMGARGGVPDTARLVGTVLGPMYADCGPFAELEGGLRGFLDAARRFPGHFYEATAAMLLVQTGRLDEASAELDRVLPRLLEGSGPRWLGSAAHAAEAAAAVGDREACERLFDALSPYSGRFAIWGGANTCAGPVDRYLGRLTLVLGRPADSVCLLEQAAFVEEQVGALPGLARTLTALADALDARGSDGDAGRARACRDRAVSIATRLGMRPLVTGRLAQDGRWTLVRDGDDWVLSADAERARLRNVRGLEYLARLLAAPRTEIAASALVSGGVEAPARAGDAVLDRPALAAYRARLDKLAAEADAADRAGDERRADAAERERAAIVEQLRGGVGLGGRARSFSSDDERARVSATKALRAAVERIAESAPLCAAHLRASLRTGRFCRYEPVPGGPPRWLVRASGDVDLC